MLHKKREPPPYHETVHKYCFMFPGREAALAASGTVGGTVAGSLLVRGRFNQGALLERTSQTEHMPGT